MIKHSGTRFLETERLILRPFQKEDGKDMFKNWASDDRVTRFLRWNTHESEQDSFTICEIWSNESKDIKNYQWAITLKDTKEVIGSIGLVDLEESMLRGEIGYAIGYNFWGQGIVKEALEELLKYFKELGFVRIQAFHELDNSNSGKVLLKSGFECEGILRKFEKNKNGELVDVKMYSIIL